MRSFLLNAASSSGSLTDIVGNWTGTIVGASSFVDGSLKLSSGYVDLGQHTFGGSFGVAMWFQLHQFQTWAYLFAFWNPNSDYYSVVPSNGQNGQFNADADGPGISGGGYGGDGRRMNGAWTHLVYTLADNGLVTIYINGNQYWSFWGARAPSQPWIVRLAGSNPFLACSVKDLQIAIGAVFTASDVQRMYAGVGCADCPANHFCSPDAPPVPCPAGSTSPAGAPRCSPIPSFAAPADVYGYEQLLDVTGFVGVKSWGVDWPQHSASFEFHPLNDFVASIRVWYGYFATSTAGGSTSGIIAMQFVSSGAREGPFRYLIWS